MKKKVILISILFVILSFSIIAVFNKNINENNIISNIEKDKQVINNNMLTLMYETESGSGEYTETKDTTWPESGYIFNDALSGCENGGELEYNSQNNTVNLLSNKSDRCYVYFDKYDGVWIDNVSVTNVTGSSVTLSVDATSENGNIATYYYALNDDEEYQESSSNIITINDLNKLTEYKISIYAVDSTNAKSNIYEITVSTTDVSIPIINSVEVSNITNKEFTVTVNSVSNNDISKYYFIIDSEDFSFISSGNSYTFSNLKRGTTYRVSIYVKDINNNISEEYGLNITTDAGLLFADYIIEKYNGTQGNNGIYYHTSSLANSAGDNSYRYSGANPNNYVCFGSDESTCSNDNLYRIIGVFGNEVKLIKNTSIGDYEWDSTKNTYSSSDIKDILNGTYLNSLGKWNDLIVTHSWKVGGIGLNGLSDVIPQIAYNNEVGPNSSNSTYSVSIGLMYVSDYYYGASPTYWTYPGWSMNGSNYDYRAAIGSNWLYLGDFEWTITRFADSDTVYRVFSSGTVGNDMVYYSYAVRPCFYLNSDVLYSSGSGTESDPIRLVV